VTWWEAVLLAAGLVALAEWNAVAWWRRREAGLREARLRRDMGLDGTVTRGERGQ
jgi:hypothetical protein